MSDGRHEHAVLHPPREADGQAACECGATRRIERGQPVGDWHACPDCTTWWGLNRAHVAPGILADRERRQQQ